MVQSASKPSVDAREATEALLRRYYAAFNEQDAAAFLDLLAEDVVHDVNQGWREVGRASFERFIERMNACYREHIYDIEVMVNADGSRAAVEYRVLGVYNNTDEGLPAASGQTYRLPGGAFFEIEDGRIARVSNYYNLQDWLAQVADPASMGQESAADADSVAYHPTGG